jgi:dTMP kinase
MKKGLFITFEGIDGCGKSTQLAQAAKSLNADGLPLLVTREPGGTPIAEKIRELLISPEHKEMATECELLLYLAARAQHVREKILPALNEGMIVLCDRFQEATIAYQGFGRGLPIELLQMINRFATQGLKPDLTFIFDISSSLSRTRIESMGKGKDRLEQNGEEFFDRIRTGYKKIAESEPQRVVLLDGTKSIGDLADIVYSKILSQIKDSF